MSGVLNCPFCGQQAQAENYAIEVAVVCVGCRAKIIRRHDAHEDTGLPLAIAAWNSRVESSALRAQLEAAEAGGRAAYQGMQEWKARAEAAEADAARWRALVSEPTAFVRVEGWQWEACDTDYTPIEQRVDDMIARTKEQQA